MGFDATVLRAPAFLETTWLVQAGDDPAFAREDLDDSHWTEFDLQKSLKTIFPKNHPQVVWYRLHVKVAPDQHSLALMAQSISPAYELFINGSRLLKSGKISPFLPYTTVGRIVVPIDDKELHSGALVIALRVYVSPGSWSKSKPGLTAHNLTLGQQREIQEHVWLREVGDDVPYWVNLLLTFSLGMVALALFIGQPRQKEYLWIFLQFVAQAVLVPYSVIEMFHDIPAQWAGLQVLLDVLNLLFQALMYFAFLRMRFSLWMRIYFSVTGLAVIGVITAVTAGSLPAVYLGVALVPFALFLSGVIPVLLIFKMARGNREAGILLIPALLSSVAYYVGLVLFFLSQLPSLQARADHLSDLLYAYQAGPFTMGMEDGGALLFNLSLLLILVLRSTRISRQQAVFEGELDAARAVQQVILPELVETIPGFTAESVYQPAQQVGGDFFQILPTGDGGLLLVIGDVAGKGLPAAMLVSVLVGAIRTLAEYTCSPQEILAKLNETLIGRANGGFSTALAAYISESGMVTIANAGHLSPYLDGEELELPGALPLGVMSGTNYESTKFFLAAGSRLTVYSDGVIEAQNQQGELFGFERGREFSTEPATAIVEAAKQFGQSDDITVVAIARNATVAAAA